MGTVTEIDLHDQDRARVIELHQRGNAPELDAHAIVLHHLPRVWLQLDDVIVQFLPAEVCPMHKAAGFDESCSQCVSFPGVVELSPCTSVWYHKDAADGLNITVQRTQLPLLPEPACSLYTLQGATADPGMIAHFAMPIRADSALQWLIVYVLLSRVRGLDSLISIGMPEKIRQIIEAGAPTEVVANFKQHNHQAYCERVTHRFGLACSRVSEPSEAVTFYNLLHIDRLSWCLWMQPCPWRVTTCGIHMGCQLRSSCVPLALHRQF